MTEEIHEEIVNILTYWFGFEYWKKSDKDPENCTAYWDDIWRQKWFAKEELTKQVDCYLQTNFGKLVESALCGDLDHWTQSCHGSLALIILLDQFTRNIYRNTKNAWSGDEKALQICLKGIENKQDQQLKQVPRAMFYMPLLHAEEISLAERSLELYLGLYNKIKENKSLTEQVLGRFKKIAEIHFRSISTFGRYPERNKYLGRTSTTAEEAYLKG